MGAASDDPAAKPRLQDVIVDNYPVPNNYYEPVQTPIAAKRQMACSALPGHLGAIAAFAVRRARRAACGARCIPTCARCAQQSAAVRPALRRGRGARRASARGVRMRLRPTRPS
jgi:hypothetical protein